jgi:predicted amidohydrolase
MPLVACQSHRYYLQAMKIALAQISPALGDIDRNLRRHLEVAEAAAEQAADLVIFPELSLAGYDSRERTAELALNAQSTELTALAEASQRADLLCGFIELGEDFRVFNSCAYFAGGALRHLHRKVYLPTYGIFDEGRYFAAGETVRAFDLWADGSRLAKASGQGRLRCGVIICEELWHPSVAYLLAQDGAQMLVAQTAAVDKGERDGEGRAAGLQVWETLARAAAVSSRAFLALANRTGAEGELCFFGSSFVVDPDGRVMARARAYAEELKLCEIQFDEVRRARTSMPLLRDERLELTARELARIQHARQ